MGFRGRGEWRVAMFFVAEKDHSWSRGPHPAFIEQTIAAEPLKAGGGLASRRFTGIVLQTDHADLDRLRVSIRKPSLASLEMAADRTLGIVIVITLVGGYAPIERLLVTHLDPGIRIGIARIADQAGVSKRNLFNRI